ncbi:hypothetical protein B7494_g2926 [Chlorociboria aeruginascens]|nr:hypothetical protein B7494_g2926 [Chlorociboria aeruginascens]
MTTTALPLKLRVAIRDNWDSPSCAIQISIKNLSQLLGLPVSINIDWPMVWYALEKSYPDVETVLPSITRTVQSSLETIQGFLEQDGMETWSDNFLDVMASHGHMLKLGIQTCKGDRALFSWSEAAETFLLLLPENASPHQPQTAAIHESLRNLFYPTKKTPASLTVVDDFEHIATPKPAKPPLHSTPISMPLLEQIPRPEDLFVSQPPYHLIVVTSAQNITIQASHQPSLELISAYFKKWSRRLKGDSRDLPIAKITLGESHFGHGILFDFLSVELCGPGRTGGLNVNVVPFLAFIENVLGYTNTSRDGSSYGQWYFRRESAYIQ